MRVVQLTFLLAFGLHAASPQWFAARSAHFEVFSDAGPEAAERTLLRFEQLRAVFDENQIIATKSTVKHRPPIRVIAFDSEGEYAAFRPRPTADAYYTATEDRDYIVMSIHEADRNFGIAAHEYAHSILYAKNLRLPRWLSEGVAELFSTVKISGRQCVFGGPLPARADVLKRRKWLSFGDLMQADSGLFYAESWAITDMLYASPAYAPHFADLVQGLAVEGADSEAVIASIYGKTADEIVEDAKRWIVSERSPSRLLPSRIPAALAVSVGPISQRRSQLIIADLFGANSRWARAAEIYQTLLKDSPNDPEILAALGAALLCQNQRIQAAAYFRRALDNHLADASLCYRYAVLADELNMPREEIERALQRAISLEPEFEDARYTLALLQNNEGKYEDAVVNLRAMGTPSPPRAFAYWVAMASALRDLDQRADAQEAADQALRCATTLDQQVRAKELRYVAGTDMTVRFVRDAQGNLQLATTRVPHGTADFNPFIEPGDHIQTADGELKEVECKEGRLTGLLIENEKGTLSLSVPDPLHVMIRNGPAQFFCGTQPRTFVKVEYASTGKPASGGLLRGMEFR